MTFLEAVGVVVTVWVALMGVTILLCVCLSRPYDRGFQDGVAEERRRHDRRGGGAAE